MLSKLVIQGDNNSIGNRFVCMLVKTGCATDIGDNVFAWSGVRVVKHAVQPDVSVCMLR